ncbi:MAG: copper homeostasis protein CutC [Gemmatimonadetes bacterium]|nr:copper homeostasis protein CutC [Gemmatimonadota bacterium]
MTDGRGLVPSSPIRPSSRVLVEACVTGVEEARAAQASGADRLELCRDLEVGGLTPDLRVLEGVLAQVAVPVNAMVRLRPGSYRTRPGDVDAMAREVERLVAAGANGVVVGLLGSDGRIDAAATRALVASASGRPVTFHRALDATPDLLEALEDVAGAGVARVLTGGGPGAASEGAPTLAELVRRSREVIVLAGGRVRSDHVVGLVESTGVKEVHARAEAVGGIVQALAVRRSAGPRPASSD